MNQSKMRTPKGKQLVSVEALSPEQARFLMTGAPRARTVPRPGRHKLQYIYDNRVTYLFCNRSGEFFAYTFCDLPFEKNFVRKPCCQEAKRVFCVCNQRTECPKHGGNCEGSHD